VVWVPGIGYYSHGYPTVAQETYSSSSGPKKKKKGRKVKEKKGKKGKKGKKKRKKGGREERNFDVKNQALGHNFSKNFKRTFF